MPCQVAHISQSTSKGLLEQSKGDNDSSSNSLFSIDPYNNAPSTSLQCASCDLNEISIDEVSKTNPLIFKRVPRQVSYKRFNFRCSDRQIICDSSKSCCGNLCLNKFGKINLRRMQEKYLSLNGEEQDTFLILHMRFVKDHNTGLNLTHVEYFLGLSTKYCQTALKIAHSVANMRLQRVQLRLLKG